MKRVHFYRFLAILLPLIVVFAFELILRAVGYGYDTHLFKTDEDARFWVMNRDVSKKYFTIAQNATIGNLEHFYKKKPIGTIRFFVLGASSSLGFPYMHNGAFPRMLKYKLQFAFPNKNIEIINLSLTAINSYTLYDFSKQLIKYEPDGIIIYAGHNEYYGALGVASSSHVNRKPWMSRLLISAKDLRIVQLLSSVGNNRSKDSYLTDENLTLMERMAAHQFVKYDSKIYREGISQFDDNMSRTLSLFSKKKIPVFIGTISGNIKDQRPLNSEDDPDHNATKEYNEGAEALISMSCDKAKEHFVNAKEYDQLRFRAPEAMNKIIRGYSGKYDNVYVVDVEKQFEANSPQGIVGKELILEHVHPNLTGQRLIAEAFYDELIRHFFPQRNLAPSEMEFDDSSLPTTVFDTIYGDMVIRRLRQQWPFNEHPQELDYDKNRFEYKVANLFFNRKIDWGEAMKRLNNYYILSKDSKDALKVVEQMCLEIPYDKTFLQQAGSLCIKIGDKGKAAFYFKKAKELW